MLKVSRGAWDPTRETLESDSERPAVRSMIASPSFTLRAIRQRVAAMMLLVVAGYMTSDAAEPARVRHETGVGNKARVASKTVEEIFAGSSPSTIDDLKAMQERQQQVARRVAPATVAVRVGPAQGSGVIVSPDGYVLTAAHVAGKPGRRVVVNLSDGQIAFGKSLGLHRDLDAGLIKLDTQIDNGRPVTWPFVELGDSSQLVPGQWVLALGHPGGFEPDRPVVVRLGRVLENRDEFVKTDCKLVGGDSGGPLFDMDGNVVGVHSRIGTSLANNMHAPAAAFRDSWNRLVNSEVWGRLPGPRPYIGVTGATENRRCVVRQVRAGGAADTAGIRGGDIVVSFAGRRVADFAALKAHVEECSPDQEVSVTIERENATLELKLIIGST